MEIAVSSIPDDPIWHSETIKVDITLLEVDMSSTSVVLKSRFNWLKQIYFDFCHMYTGRSEVETKVAYIYICDYGTRRLLHIFTAEIEAANKACMYVKNNEKNVYCFFVCFFQ